MADSAAGSAVLGKMAVSTNWAERIACDGSLAHFRWFASRRSAINLWLFFQPEFTMNKRTAISVVLAAALAVAPFSAARAQTYYVNPLFWPFLAAGAILGTAALIVTAPIRVVCSDCLPPPQAYYPFYIGPPTPAYSQQAPVGYAAPAPQPATYPAPASQPPITYSYGPRR